MSLYLRETKTVFLSKFLRCCEMSLYLRKASKKHTKQASKTVKKQVPTLFQAVLRLREARKSLFAAKTPSKTLKK